MKVTINGTVPVREFIPKLVGVIVNMRENTIRGTHTETAKQFKRIGYDEVIRFLEDIEIVSENSIARATDAT